MIFTAGKQANAKNQECKMPHE